MGKSAKGIGDGHRIKHCVGAYRLLQAGRQPPFGREERRFPISGPVGKIQFHGICVVNIMLSVSFCAVRPPHLPYEARLRVRGWLVAESATARLAHVMWATTTPTAPRPTLTRPAACAEPPDADDDPEMAADGRHWWAPSSLSLTLTHEKVLRSEARHYRRGCASWGRRNEHVIGLQ